MALTPEPALLPGSPRRARLPQEDPRAPSATFAHLGLRERDQKILALARRSLEGATVDFDEALRALRASVEELIPGGRVYLLGGTAMGPIVGSAISGVGIVPAETGVLVVRVAPQGGFTTLGRLSP
ncbi:hypothetical protein [Polyangium sp. 6x1]|uniref:hypothetical protein n=1 Tax=Polyangium sp. 6x1 TaxID=3042689 RepID=UPI0024824F9A|nr:hypothetical protein [Polyangium sp. 6x1]MDI1451184.1 hypothetical protein [Polyangium sp. 6x1]